jgi:Na+/proline symporter
MAFTGLGLLALLLLGVGFFASKKTDTMEDFIVAGRKLPFFLAVPTIVATMFGAGSCMGVSGCVYSNGLAGVVADPLAVSLTLFLAGFFFVRRFRKMRFLTIADILESSYGKRVGVFSSLLMMPFYVGTLAAQFVAIGHVTHMLTGLDFYTGMIVGAFIIAFYTSVGGMWAVTLTDFLQLILLVFGLLVIIPYSVGLVEQKALFSQVGSDLVALAPTEVRGRGWLTFFGEWLLTGFGAIVGQDLMQRALACHSPRVAKWSTVTAGILYLILGAIPILIGYAGRTLLPELGAPETLLLTLAESSLSPLLFTVVVVGLLSAIMSTADSYLLAAGSILVRNIVLPLRSHTTEKQALCFMRFSGVGLALFALVAGQMVPRIFDLMVHSTVFLFVAIFVPVTGALFLPRVSERVAWGSMICGIASWSFYLVLYSAELSTFHEATLFAASMVGFIGSLFAFLVLQLPLFTPTPSSV